VPSPSDLPWKHWITNIPPDYIVLPTQSPAIGNFGFDTDENGVSVPINYRRPCNNLCKKNDV